MQTTINYSLKYLVFLLYGNPSPHSLNPGPLRTSQVCSPWEGRGRGRKGSYDTWDNGIRLLRTMGALQKPTAARDDLEGGEDYRAWLKGGPQVA